MMLSDNTQNGIRITDLHNNVVDNELYVLSQCPHFWN